MASISKSDYDRCMTEQQKKLAGPAGLGRSAWVAYLGIATITVLLYGKVIPFGYVEHDDAILIKQDHQFLKDLSHIPEAFGRDVFHVTGMDSGKIYYRPILTISFMIDTQLGGTNLAVFHITNILIHILAACLLLHFLMALQVRKGVALFLVMAFAVHPLLVQAVAWVPGRNDSMLTVFALACLLLLMRFHRTGNWIVCGLHLLFFALALFTKENAIGLLVVQAYLLVVILRQNRRWPRVLTVGAGWLVIVTIWFLLRNAALNYPPLPPFKRGMATLFENLPMLVQYIGKILFPFNLSTTPTIQDTGYLFAALGVGCTILSLVLSKGISWRKTIFAATWFLVFLLPSFVIPGLLGFEHRIYLPFVGFLVLLHESAPLRRADPGSRMFRAIACGVVAALFAISFFRCDVFRDRDSFWASAVKSSPHSRMAHLNYGTALLEADRWEEAAALYQEYLKRDADPTLFHNNLAVIYATHKMFAEAEQEFKAEMEINPDYAEAYVNLGGLYHSTGRKDQAEKLWKKTIEISPRHLKAHSLLLRYYRSQGDSVRYQQIVKEMERKGIRVRIP